MRAAWTSTRHRARCAWTTASHYSVHQPAPHARGVDPERALHRQPMALPYADGSGLRFPDWPAPLDALAGIATARGWSLGERAALLARAVRWRLAGFRCVPQATVADLCAGLPQRLVSEFIDPLCISALNTPIHLASGTVFLACCAMPPAAVAARILVPRRDLGSLFPAPAAQWPQERGHAAPAELQPQGPHWTLGAPRPKTRPSTPCCWSAPRPGGAAHSPLPRQPACTRRHSPAALGAAGPGPAAPPHCHRYAQTFDASHIPRRPGWRCAPRLMCLRNCPTVDNRRPAGPDGLVISDSASDRETLQAQVLAQAQAQLGWHGLVALRTVIDKRATFACLSNFKARRGAGRSGRGDHVDGRIRPPSKAPCAAAGCRGQYAAHRTAHTD